MMWDYGMGWGWGGFGMGLFWLIPVLIVAVAIKYLASGSARQGDSPRRIEKTAAEYLDDAYARGEISREEFLQKREDLKRG